MSLDDSQYTMPEGGGTSFSEIEWERAKKNIQRIRDKLAKTCRHLIKGEGGPKSRKVDWTEIKAERERLDEKERDARRQARGFED